jgi:hypothetical protein
MSTGKIAVGSVFSGIGHNQQWLEMQLAALDRTTSTYDHFVYLNQADEAIFTRSTIVGKSAEKREATPSHLEGLHALRDAFRSANYDRYLILDSDCFPVRENWMPMLDAAMATAGKRYASPARVENLHFFPHPCVLYTADAELLDFNVPDETNFLASRFTTSPAARRARAGSLSLKRTVFRLTSSSPRSTTTCFTITAAAPGRSGCGRPQSGTTIISGRAATIRWCCSTG